MLQDICHNLNFKHLYIDLTRAKMKKQVTPESSLMNAISYTNKDNPEFEVLLESPSLNIFSNNTNSIENNHNGKIDNNIEDTSEIIESENVLSENINEEVFIMDVDLDMQYINQENVIIEDVVLNMDIDAGFPNDDTSLIFDNINEAVIENQVGAEESNTNNSVLENSICYEKDSIHETVTPNHVESEENLEENSECLIRKSVPDVSSAGITKMKYICLQILIEILGIDSSDTMNYKNEVGLMF